MHCYKNMELRQNSGYAYSLPAFDPPPTQPIISQSKPSRQLFVNCDPFCVSISPQWLSYCLGRLKSDSWPATTLTQAMAVSSELGTRACGPTAGCSTWLTVWGGKSLRFTIHTSPRSASACRSNCGVNVRAIPTFPAMAYTQENDTLSQLWYCITREANVKKQKRGERLTLALSQSTGCGWCRQVTRVH